jgi:hypothetical protein
LYINNINIYPSNVTIVKNAFNTLSASYDATDAKQGVFCTNKSKIVVSSNATLPSRSGESSKITYFTLRRNVYSLRIYNKVLSESEVLINANLDEKRFKNLPTVKIGDNLCTDVSVKSTTQLECTVPAGHGMRLPVTVSYDGTDRTVPGTGYTYVSEEAFYVSDINPNTGPTFGETPMTLTGGNFLTDSSRIISVTVGGMPCGSYPNPLVPNSNTSYTCSIPIMDEDGTKDVIVNVAYTLKDAFEYVEATRDPLKANIG